jgi:16S rRNA (uracil1498-N3)-methyltransferase
MTADEGDVPPRTRLYVTDALAAGASLTLDDRAAHYLRSVLRLDVGAEVALFNGRDGEWRARIAATAKRATTVTVLAQTRPQGRDPDVWLLFAPVKRARIDLIVEKATELGVTRLLPVITRRTVVGRVNVERLTSTAIEAAEQCERLSVPTVDDPAPLDSVLARWPAERRLLVGDERGDGRGGGGRPLREALATGDARPWALLVGPEGGFEPGELDGMGQFQFVTKVGLGPRVLRADTAVTAALAVVQSSIGDWSLPRGAEPMSVSSTSTPCKQ